jgi:acetylornithine/LysW-gamma-L-lysine aminotransferase
MPDILCLSKGIANGLPLGVTVTTEAVSVKVPKGSHGSTFAGNPLVCAAGGATLRILADAGIHRQATEVGNYLLERLRGLKHPSIREARGRGLMLALELKRPATPVIKAMQDHGVLALPAGTTIVRFLPALLLQREHVDAAIEVLEAALSST